MKGLTRRPGTDVHGGAVMVTLCRAADVPLLERHMPSPGAASRHARCFARHEDGTGSYLVAWRRGLPVASCEVRWGGCRAPEVRERHPDCPEIAGLGDWPEVMRDPGVGVALIDAAEALALVRGAPWMGLGVERNNPCAEALYTRLGFRGSVPYLHTWSYRDGAGAAHRAADARTFMVKRLRRTRRCRGRHGGAARW